MRRLHARRIVRPRFWQIKRPVDEGVTVPRDIAGEDTDLAVRDLARRAGILPANAARGLALLEKSGLIDYQNRVIVGERLKRIAAHEIAQVIGFPPAAAQYGLLPPRARIASGLRPHPARLAPLIAKQAVQECSCRSRNPLLRKQRAHPLLPHSAAKMPKALALLQSTLPSSMPSKSLRHMVQSAR